MMYEGIDVLDIEEIHIEDNLIDIRDKYEYLLGHINNSINVPYNYLMMNPENYLDKNKTYYIYCDSGSKSRRLCTRLNELGFSIVDLIGGYVRYLTKK